MSIKITPDAIEKVANGNVLFYSQGYQTKMIQGDATILKHKDAHAIIIKHQNDEFEIGISKLATMTLRGVVTTLTPPLNNKNAQYKATVDYVFDEFSKNYFAGGGDVVAISDIGENSAFVEVNSWTVDPLDSDYYYFDFTHNLGSSDLYWTCTDLATNEVVNPHKIVYTDSVTARVTVFGNTYRLRVSVTSGVIGVPSEIERTDVLTRRIVVTPENYSTTLGVLIDSNAEYFLDGIINMGDTSIQVPAGGIFIRGYNFDISGLISTEDNYTMFTSPVGGSGDVLFNDFHIDVSGTSSKVYEIVSDDGDQTVELGMINYNNCTSLGSIDSYRQGLETGTGRFGGSPSLELIGPWLGGFRIDTSIVREMSDLTTEPLFKAGAAFVMESRFLIDINVDLGDLQPLLDFAPSNFTNPSTVQVHGAEVTRGGVYGPSDTNITPNIDAIDLEADFDGNNGMLNTYVGGETKVTSSATTVIASSGVYVDILGTFTSGTLVHFDSPSDGQLRHLGVNPVEFKVFADFTVEGTAGVEAAIRVTLWDDSASTFVNFTPQIREINNLTGGRDVAFFTMLVNVTLEQNDFIKFTIANLSNSTNLTLEDDSFFAVDER